MIWRILSPPLDPTPGRHGRGLIAGEEERHQLVPDVAQGKRCVGAFLPPWTNSERRSFLGEASSRRRHRCSIKTTIQLAEPSPEREFARQGEPARPEKQEHPLEQQLENL